MIELREKFPCKSILQSITETSQKLNIPEEHVLQSLDNDYPGIQKYVNGCRQKRNHPSRNLKKLSGVDTFVFFDNILGKRILLLGESHEYEGLCEEDEDEDAGYDPDWKEKSVEVQYWLPNLCKNAPECIDVLIEAEYATYKYFGGESPLDDTLKKFEDCQQMSKEKNLCKKLYPYLRFHNVDARTISK